jgi:hypothetical protein
VGTHSPRCRSQWPYTIPWPLCSLWWGENWPHGAPGTDPPKIGVLECASSRTSARSTTWEALGTFLLRTNHLRTAQVLYLIGAITRGLVCSFWRVWGSKPLCNQGRATVPALPISAPGVGCPAPPLFGRFQGCLRIFLAFEGPIWGFCYEIIIWRA